MMIAAVALLFVVVGAANSSAVQATPSPPLAAQLLAQPYTTTGVQVNVSGFSDMRGLANDGTHVYLLDGSGNVTVVALADVAMAPGSSTTVTGTIHTVGWGVNGAPSMPDLSALSLAYSHGCLFITDSSNSAGNIHLYCIDITDYTVTDIPVPAAKPLPIGFYYVKSSLIDFPDGRVGKVSAYESDGSGGYTSTLRTYSVTGTGKNATIAWSEDYVMADTANWATDEHGIATDGTYLYRIQWHTVNPNTKVWALASGTAAQVVYSGSYTMPFSNMHFLSHNHTDNYYIMGFWQGSQFFITEAADPGPGPGNPLVPTFGTVTSTSGGFTAQITNFDAAYSWFGSATAGGSVTVSASGVLTVTGVASGGTSTVTIRDTRSGYPQGSATVTGTALTVVPTPPATPTTPQSGTSATHTVKAAPSAGATFSAEPTPTATPSAAESGSSQGQGASAAGSDTPPVLDPKDGKSGMHVTGDGFTMDVAGVDANGKPLPLATGNAVLLEPGSFAQLQGDGFDPGSTVDVWLHSQPRHLGTLRVAANGTFNARVPIPANVELGKHHVEVTGTTAAGHTATVTLDAVAQRAAKDSGTPCPWWILIVIVIAAALFWFILWRRRRRKKEELATRGAR
jgi:hypothetical protein